MIIVWVTLFSWQQKIVTTIRLDCLIFYDNSQDVDSNGRQKITHDGKNRQKLVSQCQFPCYYSGNAQLNNVLELAIDFCHLRSCDIADSLGRESFIWIVSTCFMNNVFTLGNISWIYFNLINGWIIENFPFFPSQRRHVCFFKSRFQW